MPEAEVTIDASKGIVTVRGDQAFVAETLEKYKSVFEKGPAFQPQQASAASHAAPINNPAGAGGKVSGLEAFPNVYDVEGENISILISPPGKNITAQARALILLFLYARHKVGDEPVGLDPIKDQCKAHACFDSKNFVGHLKSQKNLVTVTGANSSTTARLTVPGRKAAEEMAQSLQSAS